MRVMFMGTPEISARCLDAIVASSHTVVSVVTGKDKPRGRGNVMTPTPTKASAIRYGIDVNTPDTLRTDEFMDYLKGKKKPVWVRHVIVPGITYLEKPLLSLGAYLKNFDNVEKIEVLPYHTMGVVKYESLEDEYPLKGVPPLTKEDAQKALDIINRAKYN